MEDKTKIAEMLRKEEIHITDEQCDKLYRFYEMVIEKNKVMNLTAITDYTEFIIKHFVDSLMLVKELNLSNYKNMLDVGTGAGFPGIPIKVLYPDLEILLLDSLNKRLKFLDEVIRELGLKNISTIHSRAEELQSKGEYRESFDICVSRAVSVLPTLSEYCLPYVKISGYFVAYKGVNHEEIKLSQNAVKVLGGSIEEVKEFNIKGTDYGRTLVLIKKIKSTPRKYPRSAGKPVKSPLL